LNENDEMKMLWECLLFRKVLYAELFNKHIVPFAGDFQYFFHTKTNYDRTKNVYI